MEHRWILSCRLDGQLTNRGTELKRRMALRTVGRDTFTDEILPHAGLPCCLPDYRP